MPIGIKARHLDRTTALYNKNQLDHLAERGWLGGVSRISRANAVWGDASQSLDHRARSYLTSIAATVTTRKVLQTRRACCAIMKIIQRVPWAGANRPSLLDGGQAVICTE